MGDRLGQAVAALAEATDWMGRALAGDQNAALAGATPYLRLFGLAAGGHYLARGALAAARDGSALDHIALARFFAENLCVQAQGLADSVTGGADSILSVTPQRLSA
jgi:acyl-CoA dehydrogenase